MLVVSAFLLFDWYFILIIFVDIVVVVENWPVRNVDNRSMSMIYLILLLA